MKLDVEASAKIAKSIKAKKKECYTNSFKALSLLPEGSLYVEGVACIHSLGVPLDHGWCLLPDGETVIDVTWCDSAPVSYSPLAIYTMKEILEILDENRYMPVSWRGGKVTMESYMKVLRECDCGTDEE